ncbi:hypothetical protein [Geobacter sp. AOG1]|uniref:hypothetical protein n=1 Tax=Geobacter sp. AOG1 TaxID=1566346 RepID=UPI001CC783A3|nr:hypothetical protein [Geobacter sp. AOG1]GFE57870.1 hypothetical protein AOG1_17500 [Geobacter sp. AOG1]
MTQDKDDRKRPHLRLVVDNAEKRVSHPVDTGEEFIPLEDLLTRRDDFRTLFYQELSPWQAKAYEKLERFFSAREWPYGLDPEHGRLMVLPIGIVCPEAVEYGSVPQDEVLVYVAEDLEGNGLSLSVEMILPYFSEDEAVMEEAFLYSTPVHQYGTIFLEENRHDDLLDLMYRLTFPLFPPALSGRLLARLFSVAAFEFRETCRILTEFPEG